VSKFIALGGDTGAHVLASEIAAVRPSRFGSGNPAVIVVTKGGHKIRVPMPRSDHEAFVDVLLRMIAEAGE
jgi:hypothetical protein